MTASVGAREGSWVRRLHPFDVIVSLAAVTAIAWGTGAQPGLMLLVAFTAVVALGLFLAPKVSIAVIGVYLLLQPALVNLVGGVDIPIGLALQRLHQGFIVAGVLRVGCFVWSDPVASRLRRWLLLSVAFVACGTLSALVAGVPSETMALGAFLALKFQVFLLLALTISWDEQDCQRIVRVALWLGPVLLATGFLLQHLPLAVQTVFMSAGAEDEGFYQRGDLSSMQGILGHPGAFGWAMAVVGCYAVASLLTAPRSLGVVSLGSGILGIAGSLRRKPLVALPIAVVFALVRFSRGGVRWRTVVILALVGAGVGGLAVGRLRATYEDTVAGYIDPSAPTAPRTLLYLTGLQIGADRFPLGAGFGRFGGYASRIHYSPIYDQYGLSGVFGLSPEDPIYLMDTYWPHILGETGWIGVATLVCFFGMLLTRTARVGMGSRLIGSRTLAIGAGMVLVEALVESIAGPVFEGALFAFVIAVPLGITLVRLDEPPQSRRAVFVGASPLLPTSPATAPRQPPEGPL
jgi:hypothetical protein